VGSIHPFGLLVSVQGSLYREEESMIDPHFSIVLVLALVLDTAPTQ
jgi:hypothetical protein